MAPPHPPTPPPTSIVPGFPAPWTWESLASHLRLLAANSASETMAEHLVEGLRRQAPFLTPELIRRELAMIYAALVDPTFPEEVRTMS